MKVLCNTAHFTSKTSASSHVFFRALLLVMMTLFIASQAAFADENLYAKNYQAQNQGDLHSLQANPEPELFSGNRRDDDNITMLENGYDLMGFSGFEAGEVPPEQARSHGRAIQADKILVYVKKAGNASPSSKMELIKEAIKKGQSLTEKDVAAEPGKYRYYATFWAKLPPPVLGIHVIKLVSRPSSQGADEPASPSEGVRVIAVIHGSAAEQGGLLRGDQLLSINQEKVNDAATLSVLVRKFKGNTVTLKVQRKTEPLSLQVTL
ncbi:MAG: PDZ domain-containing protein [Methylophilus sp.]|uniref:PDZ domain-containing protein n=1 Tax=Methylophilus sp. TaxID=29541 RepID=UPI003FA14CA0